MILDSNIVIYATLPDYAALRHLLRKIEQDLAVSSITRLEVLGYHKLTATEKEYLSKFFEGIRHISVSESIINRATQLRQSQKMSLGDSLIAATALKEKKPLLTNNTKDFMGIAGLEVIDMAKVQAI